MDGMSGCTKALCSSFQSREAYTTDNLSAQSAIPHHVSRTAAHSAALDPARAHEAHQAAPIVPCFARLSHSVCKTRAEWLRLIAAMERVLHELIAVLEEIDTELTTSQRKIMQRIEVKVLGNLRNDTVNELLDWWRRNNNTYASPPISK